MTNHEIIVLVEEKSSAVIIEHLSASLELDRQVTILSHDGFGDLKNSIPRKLNAEHHELTRFIILCDADNTNCIERKRQLFDLVPHAKRSRTIIRIACRELEAWYIAQPEALRRGGAIKNKIPRTILSRDPDQIDNIKERSRKFIYQRGQIDLARKIGPHLNPEDKKSKSFFHFIHALRQSAL
jgi:hypothetical protein